MLQERSLGSVKILSVELEKLNKALKNAADQIKEREESIESVYLFGSFARGDFTPVSDIDILIIVSQTSQPFLERRDRFIGYFSVPFDVNPVIYTVDELKKMQEEDDDFLKKILNEAVKLI